MKDTFTLSATQLKSAMANGLICEVFGPVTGTKDLYQVKPSNLQNMALAIYRMGKADAPIIRGAKVVPMYSNKSRSITQ
jgi:hypothetical protein